ncbi:AMP-binding protein [uncultured Arcticibacterium sp.]|uniref:AMP-binding protein n=1 Tax=uncultured Arcticibacterium sp. TaxID=2173042 RepID=UPI0030F8D988
MNLIGPDTNLAKVVRDNLLKSAARSTITYLPKGEINKAVSMSGGELHKIVCDKAYTILQTTSFLQEKERPIILAMTPGLEFIITLFACIYAGVTTVVVPVSKSRIALKRLKGIIHDCGATNILTDHIGDSVFNTLTNSDNHTLSIHNLFLKNKIEYPAIKEDKLHGFSKDHSENTFIQYTSGSSKSPKGVVLNDYNILHNCFLVADLWGLNENTIQASWLPHYHDMGLMSILYPILNGGRLIFMSPISFLKKPIGWLQMISAFKATSSGAPPFAFNLCLAEKNEEELKKLDLSTWKTSFCGAETVFRKVLDDFKVKFKVFGLVPHAVFSCYGMAEIALFVGGQPENNSNEIESEPKGLVAPCFLSKRSSNSIRIVDPSTLKLLEDGKKGEIWLQSDSLSKGYILNKGSLPLDVNSTEFSYLHSDLTGKWFRTGDLGIKINHHLYVHGRLKDTIIVNGINISASDIEWYAGEVHPELNGLAAAAFRSTINKEGRARLLIEIKKSKVKDVDFHEIENVIRARIRYHFSVDLDEILILKRGCLERTTSGKVRRMEIAKNFEKLHYKSSILNN